MNRHLRFYQFPKNSEVYRVVCVLFIKPWQRVNFRVKYAPTHGTFPSFLEIDKTAGAYSLQIYDYISQIQAFLTKAFLLIVRHNPEWPPFSDWQWLHRTLFFFVGLKKRVNLVLFFKQWWNYSLTNSKHITDKKLSTCRKYIRYSEKYNNWQQRN